MRRLWRIRRGGKLVRAVGQYARLRPRSGIAGKSRFVVAMRDIDDGLAHNAGLSLRVHMSWEGESIESGVVLHKIDLLDEKRRGFYDASLRTNQLPGRCIHVDSSFE